MTQTHSNISKNPIWLKSCSSRFRLFNNCRQFCLYSVGGVYFIVHDKDIYPLQKKEKHTGIYTYVDVDSLRGIDYEYVFCFTDDFKLINTPTTISAGLLDDDIMITKEG